MTSATIVELLRQRHHSQVFIAECKMGSSFLAKRGAALRMDVFTMKPTWTANLTIGYEIKTSRQDFLRDDKWREYLPPLSRFYFVAPENLLKKEEIPDPAGLIEVEEKNGALRVAKRPKAMTPDPNALLDVLKYVAFWRVARGKETVSALRATTAGQNAR